MEREKQQILGAVSVSSGHPEQGMETTSVAPGARAAHEGWVDGEAAPQSPPGPTLWLCSGQ